MLDLTGATLGALAEQHVNPKRKFEFMGIDETDRTELLPAISRQAKQITAGSVVVQVYNGDKYWNKIKVNYDANLRQEGKIQLEVFTNDTLYLNKWKNKVWNSYKWYSGEDLDIFTGLLDGIEYREDMAFLTFRDKMGFMFDKVAGSEEAKLDFHSAAGFNTVDYSSGINPADMIWTLLTDPLLGGLDSTASSANVDIEYDEWLNWKSQMTSIGILLQGEFKGETIGTIISKIAEMSHSTIYAEGDGKIYCRYWLEKVGYTPDAGGSGDFDNDNIFSKPNLLSGTENILNRITIFYNYDTVAGTWAGHVDKDTNANLEDTTSQTSYGIRDKTFEDTTIWFSSDTVSNSFGERLIDWEAYPKNIMEFNVGLIGYAHQLSDALRANYPLLNIYFSNTEGFALQDITINVMDGTCSWKIRQVDFKNYFILDHVSLGLLDQAGNPLF